MSYPPRPVWTRSVAVPRRRVVWGIVAAAGAAIAFGLGVALGQALEENPEPTPASTTIVRTLTVPLEPAETTGG